MQTPLTEAKVSEVPVPVWEIARAKGARIVLKSLEGDLAGFLYGDAAQQIIGVNTQNAPVRQNFTVAHELAQLLLHDQEHLHLDRAFSSVRLRDDVSTMGVDDDEKEANLFAAELLAPESFVRRDPEGYTTLDLSDVDFLPEYLGYIEG